MTTELHIAVRDNQKMIIPTTKPVVFSAGPIRNAPVWQNDAMHIAVKREADIFFACPLRDGEDGFDTDLNPYLAQYKGDGQFSRQRAWEQYYLNQAGLPSNKTEGCVFFWLSRPKPRVQWPWPDKSYAQITMLELGGWLRAKEMDPQTRLVIGAEEGFPELSTVSYEIETVTGLPVYSTLEETVHAAIDVALFGV